MKVSVFHKMTVFRIMNSAGIIFATTPFNMLLSPKFLLRIQGMTSRGSIFEIGDLTALNIPGILINQCLTTPLLIVMDPKVQLIRKLFAGQAETQVSNCS